MGDDEPARGLLSHDLDGRWCLTVEDSDGVTLWTVDLPAEITSAGDALVAARAVAADEGIDVPIVALGRH